jgi:hypothetical protein
MREGRPVGVDLSERCQRVRDGLAPQPGHHPVERVRVAAELGHDRAGESGGEPVEHPLEHGSLQPIAGAPADPAGGRQQAERPGRAGHARRLGSEEINSAVTQCLHCPVTADA